MRPVKLSPVSVYYKRRYCPPLLNNRSRSVAHGHLLIPNCLSDEIIPRFVTFIQNNQMPIYRYNQSPTGNCSTAWRNTGSTFVYTLFVRFGEECSNNFCVTAVDMPFCASREQNVFRRSWNFKSANPAFLQILRHFLWLNFVRNNFSWPTSRLQTYFESSAITSTETGRDPILFLVFLLVVAMPFFSKSISLIFNESISPRLRPVPTVLLKSRRECSNS